MSYPFCQVLKHTGADSNAWRDDLEFAAAIELANKPENAKTRRLFLIRLA